MIDDLTTQGVSEPYRMFTSRAEYRLTLRADNADVRLTPMGLEWGCIGAERRAVFERDMHEIDQLTQKAESESWPPQALAQAGIKVAQDGRRRNLLEIMGQAAHEDAIESLAPWVQEYSERARNYVRTEARYSGYLVRQKREIKQLEAETEIRFPQDMDFRKIGGLSAEMQERLEQARPENFGAAQRIPGITPSALMAVLAYLKKGQHHAQVA